MYTNKNRIIALGLLFFGLLSCKKNDEAQPIYTMQYKVKLNGDDTLTSVSIDSWKVYPKENKTAWIGTSKHRHQVYAGTKTFLNRLDSVIVEPEISIHPAK